MISSILKTDTQDIGSLIARITAGVVMLPHGLQKLAGMFGGYGFSATLDFFASIGIPKLIGFLIISAESIGAVMLIIGLLGRFSAASLTIIMLGAIFMAHLPNGFFMNWFGNQKGEGFEFHILMIGLLLIVALKGSGRWSVDKLLLDKLK
ncbi:MAG: DoxX family protein [Candidatus Dadabacteria bacterium]|nr:DoxX family protein [Candidatus Dadabacteria bacterium]NIS08799.1 DoxX family protein [Candidatus Dadabacteria bacterium]NIY22149.1 DoxX family membrane protein [Candidatus Dadabacteria bacterium]